MTLRILLKDATRPAHERLERLLGLDAPDMTRGRYGEFLRCAHAFHVAMERAFESRPLHRWGLDMRVRAKRQWLERDLDFLALQPLAAAVDAPADDEPALLGRAYVLEGATLGGRVLLDTLAPRCSVSPGHGASYLAGYAADTGRMWKAFVGALDAAMLDPAERTACVEGAVSTFAGYERLLRAHGWGGSASAEL